MKRFLAFFSCVSLLLLAGCEEPYLTVSPSDLSFSQEGGSQTIQVTANNPWTARVSGSAFKISPTSGEGIVTVTVTASAATSSDEVTGTVSFESEGLTASVALKQEAKSVIQVGGVTKIPAEGGSFTVDIQYNTDFTVEIESAAQAWITFAGTKSLSSGKLTFEVKANDSTDPRTGKVTVKDNKGKVQPQTLTFEQAEKKVIQVGETAAIPAEGGTYEVDVQYNAEFNVEIEKDAQSWITFVKTKALKSGKLEFSFKANEAYEARTGKVTIKDKKGEAESQTLVFQQDAKKWVDVTGIRINVESAEVDVGETVTLTATVEPEDASDKTFTWSSDNPAIAPINEKGVVTGLALGTATITAQAGEHSATCKVTVLPSVYDRERDVLVALYKETGGDHWDDNSNWCSDQPVKEWHGIETDAKGRVTGIDLSNNGLSGQIPAEIFTLALLNDLRLDYNDLSGEIPKEVGNASLLTTLNLQHNNLSGTIPESLYGLDKLVTLQLWSNKLSGDLSEKFWDMPSLETMAIDNNKITGQLTPAIRRSKSLTWIGVGSNLLTGTIPPEITALTKLIYFSIENHPISNGTVTETQNQISGPIPTDLDKLPHLCYFLVENNNLEGGVPACLANMPELQCLELYGNRLSGVIPEEVVNCSNWDLWAPDKNIVPQQEGYTLTFSYYESTDFSQDGKVIKLQTHEKGNGIHIVITGDCFTDQDIASGEFEKIARQTMEDFFGIEPFTTFRNLFDVDAVVAVSKTRYSDYGTALGAIYGEGSFVYCEEEIVKEYSRKAVSDLDETLTIVIVNKNTKSGTAYMPYPALDTDYGSGFSYACFGLQAQDENRRLLINHEANGHGFTKLQDEYFYKGSGVFPEESKQYFKDTYFARGFYANVDFESDPTKVKWAQFLADERYKYDGLGLFEGGMVCEKGVWRASNNSIMGYQQVGYDGDRFNAPSRAAAYIRIHKLAYGSSWQFDYEEFVKYDAINRKTSANAATATLPAIGAEASYQHTPPVIMERSRR